MLKTQNRCKDPTFFEASTVREESIPVFMSIKDIKNLTAEYIQVL